jgi:hypothetical protein
MRRNVSSTASRDPYWQLKSRLERLSDAIDDLESILINEEPPYQVDDALERIRSTIVEIEEML